jgi:acetolactate synthase small subunit
MAPNEKPKAEKKDVMTAGMMLNNIKQAQKAIAKLGDRVKVVEYNNAVTALNNLYAVVKQAADAQKGNFTVHGK